MRDMLVLITTTLAVVSAPPAPVFASVDAPSHGDAEPAPPSSPLPADPGSQERGADTQPRRRLAVLPRFAYRLGDAGRTISPAAGYGLAGTIEIDYARSRALSAALGIDFGFDRFATAERGTVVVEGNVQTFRSTRVVSETSFVLVHTAAVRVGPARPYLGLGAGLGIGYFDSADAAFRPGSATGNHLLGRVSVGVDVAIRAGWEAALRIDYTAVRGVSPFRGDDGRTLTLFGDLLDVGAGIAYRF